MKTKVLSQEIYHVYYNNVLQFVTPDKNRVKNTLNIWVNNMQAKQEQLKVVSNYSDTYKVGDFLT